jgi:hypothetical protein
MADLRSDAPDPDEDAPEPPRLRALRRLVTLLTATSVAGVILVTGALVIRLSRPAPAFDAAAVAAPAVALPTGESITAAGGAPGAVILATRDAAGVERLRFFDAATGAETRTVRVDRRAP